VFVDKIQITKKIPIQRRGRGDKLSASEGKIGSLLFGPIRPPPKLESRRKRNASLLARGSLVSYRVNVNKV
jgi:hypothetical protein